MDSDAVASYAAVRIDGDPLPMDVLTPNQRAAPFTSREGGIVASNLADIAQAWGYDCDVREDMVGGSARSLPGALLAQGMVATHHLPSGLRLCISDLTTVIDNCRSGVLDRSLTVMLALDGAPHHYEVEGGGAFTVGCGQALAITAQDSTPLTGRFRAGDRTRYLVLQAHSDALRDDDLAQTLEGYLGNTRFRPLHHGPRAAHLGRALFPAAMTGLVGRLRAESCALDLLALALEEFGDAPVEASPSSPREVARILAVRDQLLSQLDKDHRLEDLARDAGMSASAFKAKFSAVVGQPVFRFLREQRLERAWAGLSEEGWTVSQAAFHVGYSYPANFATAFRRRFGIAPTDVRGVRPGGGAGETQ